MAVAEQAGIALQQAQLYEQTLISALRESLLRQIAQQLSSTYDPHQIIQIALAGMANALQVDKCDFVALLNPADVLAASALEEKQAVCGQGAHPARPSATGLVEGAPCSPADMQPGESGLKVLQEYRRTESVVSTLGQTLSGDLSWLILLDCYGRHDSLLIEDVATFPLPSQTRKNLLQADIQALLCVPILTDNTTVAGVLAAFVPLNSDPRDPEPELLSSGEDSSAAYESRFRPFSNADTELVQALADMTAVALQRALFYERARQQEATAAAIRGLTEGREAESRRLAADLHDQTLADLGALSRQIQHLVAENYGGDEGRQELEAMSNQLRETIAELRGIVEDLQPTAMRAFNLGPALRSLLERAAQRSQLPLVTRFDDRSENLLSQLDLVSQSTIFRIVQEALNNIVKHAQASRIDISITPVFADLTSGGEWKKAPEIAINLAEESRLDPAITHLEVKIIDDGVGMPEEPTQVGRHGLLNMRYRAELIGATIEWRGRRQGSGTVVQLLIPLSSS
jgi:signal transduction histidine kinase